MVAPGESHYISAHSIYRCTECGTIWQVDTVFGMHWCGQPQVLRISFHSTWHQEFLKWCLIITSIVANSEGQVSRSKGRNQLCYCNL